MKPYLFFLMIYSLAYIAVGSGCGKDDKADGEAGIGEDGGAATAGDEAGVGGSGAGDSGSSGAAGSSGSQAAGGTDGNAGTDGSAGEGGQVGSSGADGGAAAGGAGAAAGTEGADGADGADGAAATCAKSPESSCTDGQDNDCDGRTDCQDTDCAVDFISPCGLELVGGIGVAKGSDWSIVLGLHQIYDKPNPGEIFAITHHGRWYSAYTAADCYFLEELLEGFCSPACGSGQWCTPNDYCEDLPVPQHAGTLTVQGLTTGPVNLDPDASGMYPDVHLGADTFSSASFLTLTAAGGPTAAFSVSSQGVDHIDPPLSCDPNLPLAGQDYVVTFTPGSGDSWVRLILPTWHHQGLGSAIVCEAPDTGSITVPAAMIDYYLAAGAVPERTYSLIRFTRAIADLGDGRGVALEVAASQFCDFYH